MGRRGRGSRGFIGGRRLTAFIWIAALIQGGSPAYGRLFPKAGNLPRPILLPSAQILDAGFTLPTMGTVPNGPLLFSLQQQPFVAPRIRLRNDDPEYNKKSPLWVVALKVATTNIFVWAVDRYLFNYSFSHIGLQSWKNNFKMGWEWDADRLGMNFFFHPFSGGAFFNSARANGYNFLQSAPFVFVGSLMWEYLGETTRPSYNDIINTTASGALFGEIIYRLSSSLLDDRTTGMERFLREFGAGLLSPGRAFSRLLQGNLTRVTPREVYQTEPINAAVAVGAHWFNKGSTFGTGSTSAILNFHLDYGDPFEIRDRKPFDFFKLRVDLSYGKNVGKKYLDNVIAYGLLFGRTLRSGNLQILFGAFQHYNYWDSKIFEVSALGFGGGLIAKWRLSENSNIQAAFHLGLVPLAASNTPSIDIVEAGFHGRDYDYCGGGEFKFEGTLNIGKTGQLTAIYYLYGLQTYVGPPGNKIIGIFKPRIAVRLFGNLSLGAEFLFYHKDSFPQGFPSVHKANSEQKLYLMMYF